MSQSDHNSGDAESDASNDWERRVAQSLFEPPQAGGSPLDGAPGFRFEVAEAWAEARWLSGGGGTVWKGRLKSTGQTVAIKLAHDPVTTSEGQNAAERFRREHRVLSGNDRPGIVRVLATGICDGTAYLVMDWVEGKPIDLHCEQSDLSMRERVALLAAVCRALGPVHADGLVHRDLKPSNILVNAEGEPTVVDFGLVKAREGQTLTASRQQLGTVFYMAPELVSDSGAAVGEPSSASDVFALGVTLFVLLTGFYPHRSANDNAPEAYRRDVQRRAALSPRTFEGAIPSPLASVILRALEINPARRYPNAEEFGLDLERWLKGEPVQSRALHWGPRLRRWTTTHRHLILVWAGAVALSSFMGKTAWSARSSENRATANEKVASEERDKAQRQASRQEQGEAENEFAAGRLDRGLARLANALRSDPANREAAQRAGAVLQDAGFLSPTSPPLRRPGSEPVEDFCWHPAQRRLAAWGGTNGMLDFWDVDAGTWQEPLRLGATVRCAAYSPDGRWLVTAASKASGAVVWSTAEPPELKAQWPHSADVRQIVFSPDGTRAVTCTADLQIHVWDPATHQPVRLGQNHLASNYYEDTWTLPRVSFSLDSRWFVSTRINTMAANVWNAQTGERVDLLFPLQEKEEGSVMAAAMSPTGEGLAVAGARGRLAIWPWPPPAEEVPYVPRIWPESAQAPIVSLSWSANGKILFAASESGEVLRAETMSGKWLPGLRTESPVLQVQDLRPSGWLGALTYGRRLHLWPHPEEGNVMAGLPLAVPSQQILRFGVSPNVPVLAAVDEGLRLRFWDMQARRVQPTIVPQHSQAVMLNAAGDRLLAVLPGGKSMALFDASSGDTIAPSLPWQIAEIRPWVRLPPGCLSEGNDLFLTLAVQPDDHRVIAVHDLRDGKKLAAWPLNCPDLTSAAFSPDGQWCAWSGTDESVHIASAARPSLPPTTFPAGCVPGRILFSPTGQRLIVISNQDVRVFDRQSGKSTAKPVHAWDLVKDAAISADERWLAVGAADSTVRLSDLGAPAPDGTLSAKPAGSAEPVFLWHHADVLHVRFTPQGDLATLTAEGDFNVFSMPSGARKLERQGPGPCDAVDWAGPGSFWRQRNGQVQVFSLFTGRALTGSFTVPPLSAPSDPAVFCAVQSRLAMAGPQIRLWQPFVPPDRSPDWFPAWIEGIGGLRLSDAGNEELIATGLPPSIPPSATDSEARLARWHASQPGALHTGPDVLLPWQTHVERSMALLRPVPVFPDAPHLEPIPWLGDDHRQFRDFLQETAPVHPFLPLAAWSIDPRVRDEFLPSVATLAKAAPGPAEQLRGAALLLERNRADLARQFLQAAASGKSKEAGPGPLLRAIADPSTSASLLPTLKALASLTLALEAPDDASLDARHTAALLSLDAQWTCPWLESFIDRWTAINSPLQRRILDEGTLWSFAIDGASAADQLPKKWHEWTPLFAKLPVERLPRSGTASVERSHVDWSPIFDFTWNAPDPVRNSQCSINGRLLTDQTKADQWPAYVGFRFYPHAMINGHNTIVVAWRGARPETGPTLFRSDSAARWCLRDVGIDRFEPWILAQPQTEQDFWRTRAQALLSETDGYFRLNQGRYRFMRAAGDSRAALDTRLPPKVAETQMAQALDITRSALQSRSVRFDELKHQLPKLEELLDLTFAAGGPALVEDRAHELTAMVRDLAASNPDADEAMDACARGYDFLSRVGIEIGRPAFARERLQDAATLWKRLLSRDENRSEWRRGRLLNLVLDARLAMPNRSTDAWRVAVDETLGLWRKDPGNPDVVSQTLDVLALAPVSAATQDATATLRTTAHAIQNPKVKASLVIWEARQENRSTEEQQSLVQAAGVILQNGTLPPDKRRKLLLARASVLLDMATTTQPPPPTRQNLVAQAVASVRESLTASARVPDSARAWQLLDRACHLLPDDSWRSQATSLRDSLTSQGRWPDE